MCVNRWDSLLLCYLSSTVEAIFAENKRRAGRSKKNTKEGTKKTMIRNKKDDPQEGIKQHRI